MTDMGLPVGAGNTVVDQRIGGRGIGNAQQRLGEAEQGDAFTCRQTLLLQKIRDVGAGRVRGPRGADQSAGPCRDARGDGRGRSGGRQQGRVRRSQGPGARRAVSIGRPLVIAPR